MIWLRCARQPTKDKKRIIQNLQQIFHMAEKSYMQLIRGYQENHCCDTCGKEFNYKILLSNYLRNLHEVTNECDKAWQVQQNLREKTHISSTLDTTTTNLPRGAKTDAKKKWLMISPSLWSNLSLWPYGPVVPKVYSAILPSPSTGILYVMHLFVVLYFILRQLCFLVGRHKKWTRGKNCQMSPQS